MVLPKKLTDRQKCFYILEEIDEQYTVCVTDWLYERRKEFENCCRTQDVRKIDETLRLLNLLSNIVHIVDTPTKEEE